ncbi:MAG: hypothetical protein OCD01_05445 [Fibrobacterales bacterium]
MTNNEGSLERGYELEVQCERPLSIDSIHIEVSINGLIHDSLYFYKLGTSENASTKGSTITTISAGNRHTIERASFTISAHKDDSLLVKQTFFSKGFVLLRNEKSFGMLSNQSKTTTTIDENVVEILKVIDRAESETADSAFIHNTYTDLIINKMCDDFDTDEFYQVNRVYMRNNNIETEDAVLNRVMDCIFGKSLQVSSFIGINKNIPENVNIDSVFIDRFVTGDLLLKDYARSPLKDLVPEQQFIDSVQQERQLNGQ